ncbi:hypothetical protein D3C86_1761210 [compost metagenome]
MRVCPFHDTTSATMLAFQAPPAAVTAPVTQNGKIPGMMRRHQRKAPLRLKTAAASRRSDGMAMAPAITLKRMYHWDPRAMSRMPP